MPRTKPGQRVVNKPVAVVQAKYRYELDDILYDIEQMEAELSPRMVAFAQQLAQPGMLIKDAAQSAGYSLKSIKQRGTQLVRHSLVKSLVAAYKRLDMLQNGLPISWKRAKLVEIANDETAPHSSKIQAVRLLAELDGNLRPGLSEGAQIVVHLNLGGAPTGETLEHEPNDTDAGRISGGRVRGLPTGEL